MKRKIYNIIYAVLLAVIIALFLIFPDLSDGMQMFLGAVAIILTSIFTYSNRAILRRRRQKEHS